MSSTNNVARATFTKMPQNGGWSKANIQTFLRILLIILYFVKLVIGQTSSPDFLHDSTMNEQLMDGRLHDYSKSPQKTDPDHSKVTEFFIQKCFYVFSLHIHTGDIMVMLTVGKYMYNLLFFISAFYPNSIQLQA